MEEAEKKELLEIIVKAHRNTYAAPKEIRAQHKLDVPLIPGHKCYYFKEGEWEYWDIYAGSEWAPGSEVFVKNGLAKWRMSYQGQHNEKCSGKFFQEQAFPFLRKALIASTVDCPFRGLDGYREGDFEYRFRIDRDFPYLIGRESIVHIPSREEVFFQDIMGEIVK